ncbi:LysE family translocator, partial [Methylobacterium organophilum]|nr:LysE family translocator [Methylobacterium organophilum]
MTPAGFLTYALALGVAAAIPGPGIVALVARALGAGFGAV